MLVSIERRVTAISQLYVCNTFSKVKLPITDLIPEEWDEVVNFVKSLKTL